jgi:putative endonuclease
MTKSESFVYMLASGRNGTIYTGVTSNLEQRIAQHKKGIFEGFTSKYGVTQLVWISEPTEIASAIEIEKKIKNRPRAYKLALIEKTNPNWDDLYERWYPSPCAESQGPVATEGRAFSPQAANPGCCDYAQHDGEERAA